MAQSKFLVPIAEPHSAHQGSLGVPRPHRENGVVREHERAEPTPTEGIATEPTGPSPRCPPNPYVTDEGTEFKWFQGPVQVQPDGK